MISIVVPAYNVAPVIRRTLDSILAQSYGNLEVLTVNDGSTDETGTILEEYASRDSRIHPIHQENAGVTSARLAGIAAAQGQWIGFVDGDDEIEPDMYERLLSNAEKHSADISHCGYQMVFADGRIHFFYNTGIVRIQNRMQGLCDLLDGTLVEPGLCNKLYRRSLFDTVVPQLDTSIRINEDLLMNYYLFSAAETAVFDDWCPYHYIVRQNSASRISRNLHQIWDPIRVRQKIIDADITGMESAAKKSYLSTCINIYSGLILSNSQEFHAEEKKIRDMIYTNRVWIPLLSQKRKLLARLILLVPHLYKFLYRVYDRFFLNNPYQ